MLIHLSPRYYNKYCSVMVELIDVSIPLFDIVLSNGKELMVKKPLPNKLYSIACKKKGQKAISGIFFETDKPVKEFTAITRWLVDGDVVVHTVHYRLVESEFDAVTDSVIMWNGIFNTPFENRIPKSFSNFELAESSPRIDVDDYSLSDYIIEKRNQEGVVSSRSEVFMMPTVERERLTNNYFLTERLPAYEDAFHVNVKDDIPVLKCLSNSAIQKIDIRDWLDLIIDEINDDFAVNALIPITFEILKHEESFFSNTNDLSLKAGFYSSTYQNLSTEEKERVDSVFVSLLFSIS